MDDIGPIFCESLVLGDVSVNKVLACYMICKLHFVMGDIIVCVSGFWGEVSVSKVLYFNTFSYG